ncbi:MAG TPA: hypothetical protein VGI65_18755 [Steroidobacteraceae bacterium]|jgi:hypothetical protein
MLALLTLSACGFGTTGTGGVATAPPPDSSSGATTSSPPPKAAAGGSGVTGTDNAVAASASVGSALMVAVGASQTIVVTFTSNDGLMLSGFAVSGSLGLLPPGWSGPSTFTCSAVGPGSGCALNLTYAPLATDRGTLTLNCVYIDNAGLPRTPGPCLTLSYAAAMPNNVVATVSPAGEIDAIAGSSKQSVNVNFTSDDGSAITNLTLATSLAALPAGWSSSATGLSCPVVSTGSGCQLALQFAPTARAAGVLALNYGYVDSSGASRSGTINIPFASASMGTVRASVSPTGQINAVETTGSQAVAITFTTDDGNAATGLSLAADLTALPSGWSSASKSFSCDSVSTGNGCQLQLQYAPTTLGGGSLALRYNYVDSSGAANSGLLNVPYSATTNDTVTGAVSPSGEVVAMLASAGQPVSVTFTTDDSRLATALQVTSLGALPAGWSSAASSFTCGVLTTGSACQLMLLFAPTAIDSGTLTLNYSYLNNAGEAKTASLGIPYRTTSNDNVVAAPNPVSLAVAVGSSNGVAVTFNTDDGNLAGALTADLTALPADWSAASGTFTCAAVSVGNGCQLSLTYAPTAAANAVLSFGFSYTNGAGAMKTGTVSIPYSASP